MKLFIKNAEKMPKWKGCKKAINFILTSDSIVVPFTDINNKILIDKATAEIGFTKLANMGYG